MREHSRSGDASSTSMTSKPSRERPGVSWRKKERAALKRASLNYLRLSPGSQGCISPPDHVQIFVRPLYSSHRLRPLDVQEPHYIRPLLPSCLSGPQIYVKEHLAPALYLPFQLGLKGVPLAQEEAINDLLPGLHASDFTEQMYRVLSGMSVPRGTLCLMTPLRALEDESMPV